MSIAAEGHLVGEKKIFETSIFKKKWNDKYITCTYIFVYQISQDSQQLEVNIQNLPLKSLREIYKEGKSQKRKKEKKKRQVHKK